MGKIIWSMIGQGLHILFSPTRDSESFDDEDENGSSDEELDDPQEREQMPGLGPSNEDDYNAWVPEHGSSDEELDDSLMAVGDPQTRRMKSGPRREQMPGLGPSNEDDYKAWVPESGSSDEELDDPQSGGMTSGPEYTSHVDNLMWTYRDVKFKRASLDDKSRVYDEEQEAGLRMQITLGENEICKIMGDLQALYCLENPLRKKTSLDVNEVYKVVGVLCSICMKPPNSQNISQNVETALFTSLLLQRHVMTEENVVGEHLPISVDVEGDAPQGDAAQGDAAQGDAAQGDAAQGDAAQGDAAQGEAPQEDAPQAANN